MHTSQSEKPQTFLTQALSACRKALYYTLLFSFVSNVMMLAVPIYSLQVLDRVLSSGSLETLLMLSIIVVAVLVAQGLVQIARSLVLIRLGEWLDQRVSPQLFSHAVGQTSITSQGMGEQQLRDLSTLKGFVAGQGLSTLLDAPWALIFIAILFMIHPVHGLLALAGGLTLFGLAYVNEKLTKQALEAANEEYLISMRKAEQAHQHAEVIAAMGMLPTILRGWQDSHFKAMQQQSIASNHAAILSGTSRFVRFALQIGVIGAGGYLVLNNAITAGAMIAGSIIISRALAPFEASISSWKTFVAARQSYRRIEKNLTELEARPVAMRLPAPEGVLSVEQLIYMPPGAAKPILRDVNFAVQPGEVLGVVGPSAAGKTTLAKLLVGIWSATRGAVRLDGADVYSWPREEFGKYVGYMPQDVQLFSGTIKENISKMNPNPDPEAVVAAAKLANVHDMVLQFPAGYETEVGLGGALLSAGQRQRIGLARAFFGSPRFIVLDEPNSNLDYEGDAALVNALEAAKENNITCVIITHRPLIMSAVDNVMVLKNGSMVAFGPKQEVASQLQSFGQTPQQNTTKE